MTSGLFTLFFIVMLSPSLGWVQGTQNSVPKTSSVISVATAKQKDDEVAALRVYLEELRYEVLGMKALISRINRNTKVLRSSFREFKTAKCSDHESASEYQNINCPYGFDASTPTSCYKFMPERVTWYEAQARCTAIRSHLVSLESDAEQRFVSKHLTELRKLRNCDVWTGGTDVKTEGVWRWNHTGNIVATSHWHSGEPNNSNGQEDCAWMDWYFGWAWNDAACDRDRACFVCEVDV